MSEKTPFESFGDADNVRPLDLLRLGRVGYAEAFRLQEEHRDAILAGAAHDALFLVEHPPVFTLGRNADAGDVTAGRDWLEAQGIEVVETNRGGQVTYHGPGQLVGYPVLDLKPDRRDVRRYVRALQETLVLALAEYGIEAEGGSGDTIGVWTREAAPRKIASIGIHLKRWVTIHGFALNVDTQLDHFGGIVACGLPDVRMTSMAQLLGTAPPLEEVTSIVARAFVSRFGYETARPEVSQVSEPGSRRATPPPSVAERVH